MRGSLVRPMLAQIAQLDTAATGADPDGPGPLTHGYDDVFREPVVLPGQSGEGPATVNRIEKALILIPAQVEVDEAEREREFAAGNVPLFEMRLIFHYADLERLGLIDANTGEPLLRLGDRLNAIYSPCGNTLIRVFRNPPGLYFTEVQDNSFGLSAGTRNLLIVRLEPRDRGVST